MAGFEGVLVLQELNPLESPQFKYIHFVGIGGISMSGLAEILLNLGYRISGSDIKSSNITGRLERMGVRFCPHHSSDNVQDQDLIVYTAAVKENNPEIIKAKELNIPIIDRATLLGQIMKRYPFSIAISGTHGKTTTTSMITMIMIEAGFNPTVHIGGELEAIGGNTKIGGNEYFITEACEYVESFLKFYPYLAVVLNIEADHLDYFKDIGHIKEAFFKFASLVPDEGYVVACIDDKNTSQMLEKLSCNKVTFGMDNSDAMWTARDVVFDGLGHATFKLIYGNKELTEIKLRVPGVHNVINALAAIASCYTLGCGIVSIKRGLISFTGTHRRFEVKGVTRDSIKVIDDYAHHPSEVMATLKAARNCGQPRIWCVFQPHTYTRTKALLKEFSEAFNDADTILVSDIYAAREPDTGEIHSSRLAEEISVKGKKALYIKGFESITEYLEENAAPGDMIITMGAGDIYRVGEMFLNRKG
jgi:UDP-N-acetylmuramate--alanine ligase